MDGTDRGRGRSAILSLLGGGEAPLSRTQRALAAYVAGHYRTVAFSTVAEVARAASVSEASVVRFAHALGFSGYPALQKEIRRIVRADMDGAERLTAAAPEQAGPLARVLAKERENLAHLAERQDPAALVRAAALLRRARRVLVLGARASAPLAFQLWFALDKLGLPVSRSVAADSEAADAIGRMDGRDALVVIGFPRYLRRLVELAGQARRNGVRVIAITDSPFSPLAGDVALHAPAESASFVGYHAAPLVLVTALIEAVVDADRDAALAALKAFEAIAAEQGYFHQG
jgi:DNA-binding MurR/RpiR family transcriptional regulator